MSVRERVEYFASLALRIGLAFSFLYVAIAGFIAPDSWIGFVPQWMRDIYSPYSLLYGHLAFDMVLGLWMLSGWKTKYGAALSALNLFVITIVNFGSFDIIFRDVGLFFSAVALFFLAYSQE